MRLIVLVTLVAATSCATAQKISKLANSLVINSPATANAHVGISIYEPATGKYIYNFNADKYFIPASNTKIASCYAAMTILGDSLLGLQYNKSSNGYEIFPTGDPTLLHPDYKNQPVFEFLKTIPKYQINFNAWQTTAWGSGWAWNDYNDDYNVERSAMPLYGNMVAVSHVGNNDVSYPSYFFGPNNADMQKQEPITSGNKYYILRDQHSNNFVLKSDDVVFKNQIIPYVTSNLLTQKLLYDTLSKVRTATNNPLHLENNNTRYNIYSQPTDSMLKPMMQQSDNFFAEQSLLMASYAKFGIINEDSIINYLLATTLKDIPQKPRWVDGSGLSRYNLFTPQSLVYILTQLQNTVGMSRIKGVFATGSMPGTIKNYYKNLTGKLFAKTGTLNGVCCLSGYLYTKKGKLFVFSTMVNGYQGSATVVRRAVEAFITSVYNKY